VAGEGREGGVRIPRRKKLEPKLLVDMPFGEFLERLVRVKPEEVHASMLKELLHVDRGKDGDDEPQPA
jgi:hypothetical protein